METQKSWSEAQLVAGRLGRSSWRSNIKSAPAPECTRAYKQSAASSLVSHKNHK